VGAGLGANFPSTAGLSKSWKKFDAMRQKKRGTTHHKNQPYVLACVK
jgi:hypothetical protein